MRLTQIDIRQLPGIDPICVSDFAGGVNFIVGPNAIGKSSLIRALHYVLAGYRPDDPSALSISVTFRDQHTTWIGSRNGRDVTWQRDGQISAPPSLPSSEALHCYWLRAESLLVPSNADEAALRQRLREALAGGIDLEAVRKSAQLGSRAFPSGLFGEWRQALAQRQSTERDYAALELKRHQLPHLQSEQTQARQARDQLERLRLAEQLQQASQARQNAQAHCARFPEVLAQFNGSEKDWADSLTDTQARLNEEARELALESEQKHAQRQATGLADNAPSSAEINQAKQIIEALRDLHQQRQQSALAIEQANAQEQLAGDDLGTIPDPLPTLTPAQIDAMGDALREHAEAKLWQARTHTTSPPQGVTERITLSVIAAGAGISAVSGWLTANPGALLGGGITLVAVVIAALAPRLRQAPGQSPTQTAVDAAQARLDALIDAYGLHGLNLGALGLTQWMALTRRIDESRAAHTAAQTQYAHYHQAFTEQLEQLKALIGPYTPLPSSDLPALRAAVEDLAERSQQASALQQAITTLEGHKKALAQRQADNQKARETLYTKAGLALDDYTGLQALIDRYAHYVSAHEALDKARLAQTQLEASLSPHTELVDWAKSASVNEIQSALSECAREADRLDTLDTDIAQLKATLNQAGGDEALAKAMANEHALEDQLQTRKEQMIKAQLGDWLLSDVEKTYRTQHEPALLQDAKQRFETFTHTQWSLEVDDNHQPIARDLRTRARRPLSALSSGTRMQLLLAARLAWARDQERGAAPLPLVLDEALTNTDQQRFAQAVENLEALSATEDRQILYLSARREDAMRWAGKSPAAPHVIDLAALRGYTDRAESLPDIMAPALPPSPDGLSASAYAQALDVPGVSLMHEPSSIHLFYLLSDDLNTLHWLLTDYQLTALGPLSAWLKQPAGKAAVANGKGAQLSHRIDIALAWHALAKQGIGQPVDRAVLERSQVLTDTMVDQVAEQANQHHGSAQALIDALTNRVIPRLNHQYVESLKDWLSEHGYLDERPILSETTITQTLLAQHAHQIEPALIQHLSASLSAGANAQPTSSS